MSPTIDASSDDATTSRKDLENGIGGDGSGSEDDVDQTLDASNSQTPGAGSSKKSKKKKKKTTGGVGTLSRLCDHTRSTDLAITVRSLWDFSPYHYLAYHQPTYAFTFSWMPLWNSQRQTRRQYVQFWPGVRVFLLRLKKWIDYWPLRQTRSTTAMWWFGKMFVRITPKSSTLSLLILFSR